MIIFTKIRFLTYLLFDNQSIINRIQKHLFIRTKKMCCRKYDA
jgi:hypothetical protein